MGFRRGGMEECVLCFGSHLCCVEEAIGLVGFGENRLGVVVAVVMSRGSATALEWMEGFRALTQ